MANPPKPWKVEYAKSSRSSCKSCKNPIEKEKLRLGKMVQATQFDGFMPMWNHADCILKKANQIKFLDDVEGIDLLRWEDQQKIRKCLEDGGGSSNSTVVAFTECGVEVSPTSRATCKCCNQKIMKGEVRISTKLDGQAARSLAWHHANCFMESYSAMQIEKLSGWDSLSISDQAAVRALGKKATPTTKSVPRCQTVIDILVKHAFDNIARFTSQQRDAIGKLWASIREQHARRKQGKSITGKLDMNAFERLQQKYASEKISIRHAVGGGGDRRAQQWLG
ncbi:hypothetical protein HHK36_022578 [Tetracentron sinense]|uniref:PARP-type domain-containing protein n=1 Tax=Tetracentron sinense TaxID=13715 RepID=A0A835D6X4_TETSI|nr:hypothetical protein HHK36_022578 [Tetracentron sinense]